MPGIGIGVGAAFGGGLPPAFPVEIAFDPDPVVAGEEGILVVSWPDGSPLATPQSVISFDNFSHTYAAAGTYTVTATATYEGYRTGRATAAWEVADPTELALTGPADNRLHQRTAGEEDGPVPLAGTYTGAAPASVEARVLLAADDSEVLAWTALTGVSAAGGNWSGTLPGVPQGGPYYVQVRPAANPSAVETGATTWSVGAVVLVAGQSNAGALMNALGGSPPARHADTWWFNNNGGDVWAAPPESLGARTLLNGLRTLYGCPVAALMGHKPGATIAELLPGHASANYEDSFLAPLTASGAGGFEAVVWVQGESDTDPLTARATYNSRATTLFAAYRTAAGRDAADCPVLAVGLGRVTTLTTEEERDAWDYMGDTLRLLEGSVGECYYAATRMDLTLADYVHLDAAGAGDLAERLVHTFGYLAGDEDGPAVWYVTAAAYVDDTTTRLTVAPTVGTDFGPATGITGFDVSNNGGSSWEGADADRVDATHIDLTYVTATAATSWRYQHGGEPDVSGMVVDDSALLLPLASYGASAVSGVPPPPPPPPPSGPYAHVVTAEIDGGPNGGTSGTVDTTGASLLVAWVTGYSGGGGFPALSDSKGNTWTALTAQTTAGGDPRGQLFYCLNATVGTNHSFTLTGPSSFSSAIVVAFEGGTPAYVTEVGTTGASTTPSPGAVVPGGDDRLLVFACGGSNGAGDITAVDVGTLAAHAAGVFGQTYSRAVGYEIQTAAATRTPVFTAAGFSNWPAAAAVFS
jgi:hypothetical protein